jgi:hypothetical protein
MSLLSIYERCFCFKLAPTRRMTLHLKIILCSTKMCQPEMSYSIFQYFSLFYPLLIFCFLRGNVMIFFVKVEGLYFAVIYGILQYFAIICIILQYFAYFAVFFKENAVFCSISLEKMQFFAVKL